VIAALGMLAPTSMVVSADDEFACAPEGKMKKVQLSSFSMEGTLCYIHVDLFLFFAVVYPARFVSSFPTTLHYTTRSQLNPFIFLYSTIRTVQTHSLPCL
jgi:hypothetical protein